MNPVTKIIFALAFVIFALPSVASAGIEDNISAWAWSSNIGWISMNCINVRGSCTASNYGVNKNDDGTLSGYAWSSNIGWIKFGGFSESPSDFPKGSGTQPKNANINLGNGKLQGWVRACAGTVNGDCTGASRTDGWDGWISLAGTTTSGAPYGVTLDGNVSTFASQYTCLTDCAWGSDVVGWVDFSGVRIEATVDPSTCTDGIRNGDETRVDAGGRCGGGSTPSITVIRKKSDGTSYSSGCYIKTGTITESVTCGNTYPKSSGAYTAIVDTLTGHKTTSRTCTTTTSGSINCNDINIDSTEVLFSLGLDTSNVTATLTHTPISGGDSCSILPRQHYKCDDGNETTNQASKVSSPTKWTWTCRTMQCTENKRPGFIEN